MRGEAEAIALAAETKADTLLSDEREGHEMARRLGLPITGVLGVLLRAKRVKEIDAIEPELMAPREHARFFVSRDLQAQILQEANE